MRWALQTAATKFAGPPNSLASKKNSLLRTLEDYATSFANRIEYTIGGRLHLQPATGNLVIPLALRGHEHHLTKPMRHHSG